MQQQELYIGVMSGTSLDGVDTVLVSMENEGINLVASDYFAMPSTLKQKVLNIAQAQPSSVQQIGELDNQLGHLFADAVNQLLTKTNIKPEQVRAIGCHGQTVYHQPTGDTPFTMQLGDANVIAAKTEITTIADFRRKDMALGGQGAPLVPAFHQTIFSTKSSTVVVANIGGIANISVLNPDKATLGYDTGPGNILMDAWIYQQCGKKYDHDGEFAKSGSVNQELLSKLCADGYFLLPAPKSTGRELFNLSWLNKHLNTVEALIEPQDVQATLVEFTAKTIANEVIKYQQGSSPQLWVCGGGSKNSQLIQRVQSNLPSWAVDITDKKGVDSDYMEAIAFAWLAQRRTHNLPSNLPEVTGASKAASLGVIFPAN